jgi:NAD(P)-dependent dehydrogenase (short-subunit alcohol dehydrogenase family)
MSNNKNVCRYLITGANSHLGKYLANHLSKTANNKVFTTSRRPSKFDNLPKAKNHQHLKGIDLLQPEDLSRLAAAVDRWADGPFQIINCVGYFPGYITIRETSIEEACRVFESNVLSLFATANALLPIMQSKGGGHFIAFSSHAVTQSYPLMAAFTAAKASVDSLIQSIANEYSQHHIAANALAIATLDSPKERAIRPAAKKSDWLRAEQIARLVENIVQTPFGVMNGNTIHLFNYSNTFFHQSFYDRLGIKRQIAESAVSKRTPG